jgi:murein DD-endopeptidase MepM/ murein hydrolase activator NlpD
LTDGQAIEPGARKPLFRDHEIILRTDGDVRFLRLSASLQRRAATLAAAVLLIWLAATAAMLGWQAWTSWKTRDVAARALAVEQAEARVAAEKRSATELAETLEARQDQLEALFRAHFGDEPEAQPAAARDEGAAPPATDPAGRLAATGERQAMMVAALTDIAAERAARAEAALRTMGIRPEARVGQGGPFVPLAPLPGSDRADPAIRKLALTLVRMEQMEAMLVALPSALPADSPDMSSGFGIRFDPFNGQRAMHTGLDFRGPHGTPIRAAAPGRVSFVGVRQGYGNTIEVDHGHGIVTLYAHLAGFAAREGQAVQAGEKIGRMGSTGRSTGTHLHFEVRVDGTPVNPRRFLEANRDVLEVKADARQRLLGRDA